MNLRRSTDLMSSDDYIADLKTGRVHRELVNIWDKIDNTVREIKEMGTANEQRLMGYVATLTTLASTLGTQIQALKDKVDASPAPTEDFEDEFAALDGAVGQLNSLVEAIPATAQPTPTPVPVAGPTDLNQDPNNTATVTPLAGASGTTDGGTPVSEAQQPGTDTGNPGAVAPENPPPADPSEEIGDAGASDSEPTTVSDSTTAESDAGPATPGAGTGQEPEDVTGTDEDDFDEI